jgi:hypothetical protein
MGAALVKAILGKSPEWTLVKIAHPDEFTSTAVNSKQVPIPGPETFDQARCLSWVKTGKAQCEHMFSALPPRADIAQYSRHVRFVPHPDIRDVAATRELLLLRGVGEAQSRGR